MYLTYIQNWWNKNWSCIVLSLYQCIMYLLFVITKISWEETVSLKLTNLDIEGLNRNILMDQLQYNEGTIQSHYWMENILFFVTKGQYLIIYYLRSMAIYHCKKNMPIRRVRYWSLSYPYIQLIPHLPIYNI